MKSLNCLLGLIVAFCLLGTRMAGADPIKLFDEHRSHSPATFQFDVTVPAIPGGQQARLALDARIDWRNEPDSADAGQHRVVDSVSPSP